MSTRRSRILSVSALVISASLLSGCDLLLLNPSGDVAAQQGELIIYSTILMLIVILPVLALTVFFAWKYRESNREARYEPDWDHSISLEIVVWSLPLAIIICLGGLTWVATHRLNPYDEVRRIAPGVPVDETVKPLTIQVVALDWKWLFIYPEQNIAMVNEVAAITDRPVEFKLTSSTVMNSFYIPSLAGMIYTMPGMETEMNAVMNEDGVYEGFASNYSGLGYNWMRFTFHSTDEAGFDEWVEKVRSEGATLDRDAFVALDQPSMKHPVTPYGTVEDGLWTRILNQCVDDQSLCLNDMMMVDALGGGGLEGIYNREIYRGLCTAENPHALIEILRPQDAHREAALLSAIGGTPPMPPVSTAKPQTSTGPEGQ
ncbi:ubiquinol oxidase subunit II [Marinibacterium profundimaris]|uniref:ubiquinol oxidase subunit II n=1 Tax=Marinibacterium profundimaris TaxID=1679460 RepID=UPI000B51FB09|nr:ubiquinol oxidase subunit II [Marinibacterium profundimaris]